MICIICNKEIIDDKFMFPNDKPYFNIYVHKTCYKGIDVLEYITKNLDLIYNYLLERDKNRRR